MERFLWCKVNLFKLIISKEYKKIKVFSKKRRIFKTYVVYGINTKNIIKI